MIQYHRGQHLSARRLRPKPSPERAPKTAVVQLDCLHTAEFDLPVPEPKQPAYCRACRDYSRVT